MASAAEVEEAGRWYFRRDILDRLEEYFKGLAALQRYDHETYQFYRQIGAILAPHSTEQMLKLQEDDALLNVPHKELMHGGAVAFRVDNEKIEGRDFVTPLMAIIHKYNRSSPDLEWYDGPIYGLSIMYRLSNGHITLMGQLPIAVIHDGGTMILRRRNTEYQKLPFTGWSGAHYGRISVPHTGWHWNGELKMLAAEWKMDLAETMQTMLRLFAQVYALIYHAQADTRISVTNAAGLVASFGVDMMRLPYFFAERDREGRNLKRRAIFHIVRAHQRIGGSVVHSHVRGQRSFVWKGHQVHITLPGKHHTSLTDFCAGSFEVDDPQLLGTRTLSMPGVGRFLARELRR